MLYKTAIIGCGRIGCSFDDKQTQYVKTHAGAYSKCKKTQLIALCDIDKNKLQKYGKKYKVSKLYTDYKLMLNENEIDIISICTHASNHHEIVKEATKNKILGIFIEKPIANNLKNALKIMELCKKNKIKLVIDYQREYIPIYHKLKQFLKDKKMGKIQKIIIHYGGGIANTGSHVFDVLLLLFGDVKEITANLSSNESNNKFDPNLDVKIKFNNDIICILNALDVNNYGILEMDIFGTEGRIKLDLIEHDANFYKISKEGLVYKKLKKGKKINSKKENQPILSALENLLFSIKDKSNPICSFDQGIDSLEMIIGSMISMNKNKTIAFPIKNKKFEIFSK